MRAVRIVAPNNSELAVVDSPLPAPGEVLVKVVAAGISGSDIEILRGTRPAPYVRYPIVPGHEWAGTVVEVSDDVQYVGPRDRVVMLPKVDDLAHRVRAARCASLRGTKRFQIQILVGGRGHYLNDRVELEGHVLGLIRTHRDHLDQASAGG